jgi:hypothetical protein
MTAGVVVAAGVAADTEAAGAAVAARAVDRVLQLADTCGIAGCLLAHRPCHHRAVGAKPSGCSARLVRHLVGADTALDAGGAARVAHADTERLARRCDLALAIDADRAHAPRRRLAGGTLLSSRAAAPGGRRVDADLQHGVPAAAAALASPALTADTGRVAAPTVLRAAARVDADPPTELLLAAGRPIARDTKIVTGASVRRVSRGVGEEEVTPRQRQREEQQVDAMAAILSLWGSHQSTLCSG